MVVYVRINARRSGQRSFFYSESPEGNQTQEPPTLTFTHTEMDMRPVNFGGSSTCYRRI
jgi:hypothetical protein